MTDKEKARSDVERLKFEVAQEMGLGSQDKTGQKNKNKKS